MSNKKVEENEGIKGDQTYSSSSPKKKDKYVPGKPALKMGKRPLARNAIYSKIAMYGDSIIQVLLWEMINSDSSSARVNAAKTLLNKVVPDLKSVEVQDDSKEKLLVALTLFGSSFRDYVKSRVTREDKEDRLPRTIELPQERQADDSFRVVVPERS